MAQPPVSVSPPEAETAMLAEYIQRAWALNEQQLHPFGAANDDTTPEPPPMLRRGKINRIIYYVGSFNPPHLGHQALMTHVLTHSRHEADPEFNAAAIIAIVHSERWVQRKIAIESAHQGRPLHLPFNQRKALLEQGLPAPLRRTGVWVFPRPLDDWFAYIERLAGVCRADGFLVEFHELLGPDYIRQARPQRSGMHGAVTSDVCRAVDFLGPGGCGRLGELVGFGPWERVVVGGGKKTDEVWVCRERGRGEGGYTIRFARSKERTLDPDLSSTGLRQIIASCETEELLEKVRGAAMSPEMLVDIIRERGRKW